jgi:hypothetical protein
MKQITIISEDHPGVVAEISEALAAAGVNIETLAAESIDNSAVTILTVDKYDEALRALSQTHLKAISEDAIVVKLDDRPGELANLTRRFRDAKINLRSIRIIRRDAGKSFVAISTERTDEAMALVDDVLIA